MRSQIRATYVWQDYAVLIRYTVGKMGFEVTLLVVQHSQVVPKRKE